jgi:hypothetical protein
MPLSAVADTSLVRLPRTSVKRAATFGPPPSPLQLSICRQLTFASNRASCLSTDSRPQAHRAEGIESDPQHEHLRSRRFVKRNHCGHERGHARQYRRVVVTHARLAGSQSASSAWLWPPMNGGSIPPCSLCEFWHGRERFAGQSVNCEQKKRISARSSPPSSVPSGYYPEKIRFDIGRTVWPTLARFGGSSGRRSTRTGSRYLCERRRQCGRLL